MEDGREMMIEEKRKNKEEDGCFMGEKKGTSLQCDYQVCKQTTSEALSDVDVVKSNRRPKKQVLGTKEMFCACSSFGHGKHFLDRGCFCTDSDRTTLHAWKVLHDFEAYFNEACRLSNTCRVILAS